MHRAFFLDAVLREDREAGIIRDGAVSNQPRVVKVLIALLVSMTTGAIVLMTLGNNAPSAGPFCLSSYYRLDPVEKAISSRACQSRDRWLCIEIYFSGTDGGNIEQLAALSGSTEPDNLNCHFVICNGRGGGDGQIQPTETWQEQWSITPGGNWYGSGQTIRICIVADGKAAYPTDCQIKRLEALVEGLFGRFSIQPERVYYPRDCQ
ncbi:MAG: hypothetical protein JSU70_21715 [Phycisphaerales bacterium]|nr:MAG: hypothetical protein JSU70_21715 [Phycisphaerales bacterium]